MKARALCCLRSQASCHLPCTCLLFGIPSYIASKGLLFLDNEGCLSCTSKVSCSIFCMQFGIRRCPYQGTGGLISVSSSDDPALALWAFSKLLTYTVFFPACCTACCFKEAILRFSLACMGTSPKNNLLARLGGLCPGRSCAGFIVPTCCHVLVVYPL